MKMLAPMFLILFVLTPQLLGKNLYVSTTGNDSVSYANNDVDHPWLTIQQAVKTMQSGDTLLVRSGIYQETVAVSSGGRSGAYKTITNYPGETPILDGNSRTLLRGFDLANGVGYVRIIGFEIRYFKNFGITNWYGNYNNYIEVRQCNVHHCGTGNVHVLEGGIVFYGNASSFMDHLTIDGNESHHNYRSGICVLRCNNSVISNNLIYRNPETMLSANSDVYALHFADNFNNNTVFGNGVFFSQKSARIQQNCSGNTLSNNIFAYNGFCGLDLNDHVANHIVMNNVFAYNNILGANPKSTGTTANKFWNNVFYKNGYIGLNQNDGASLTEFQNNILVGSQYGAELGATGAAGRYDYNCYYSNNINLYGSPVDSHAKSVDPQFEDVNYLKFSAKNPSLRSSGNNPPGFGDHIGLTDSFLYSQRTFPYLTLSVINASYDRAGASKTIDGRTYNDSFAWRSNEDRGWIIYDLGSVKQIQYVGLNGGSAVYKSPNTFKILASTTGTNDGDFSVAFSGAYVAAGITIWCSMSQWFEFPAVNARYVKLAIDSAQADFEGKNVTGNVQVMEFYAIGPSESYSRRFNAPRDLKVIK